MKSSSKHGVVMLLALVLALTGCALPRRAAEAPRPQNPASAPASQPDKPTFAATQPKPAKPAVPPKLDVPPEEQFAAALAALKDKDIATARAGFAALAKTHPELSGPLTNLAILDARANAREAAIAGFSRAVVANPANATAYNWLGILYREARDYSRAEQAYLKALALKPDYAPLQLNLGILYEAMRRPGEALARYREYQRTTGSKDLKITAWIKALEASGAVVPQLAPAPLPGAAALAGGGS